MSGPSLHNGMLAYEKIMYEQGLSNRALEKPMTM